ncbi:hypothetical protein A0H81_11937 [Grifola frondosa]|uniref:Uncharacterized protein n=1 Tax=Grifola frondosa TaxID=5627 RepID=A0A1C7LVI5_GRIFR|nr:hypothetical protein A0H81_11937 [Grifola frondosa]
MRVESRGLQETYQHRTWDRPTSSKDIQRAVEAVINKDDDIIHMSDLDEAKVADDVMAKSWLLHKSSLNICTSPRPSSLPHPQRHSYDPIRTYAQWPQTQQFPDSFFAFAAMLLLIFLYPSKTNVGGTITHFGVFGFTGSAIPALDGFSRRRRPPQLYPFPQPHAVLILIPISAGLSGLAFLFGVCGASYHRVGTVFMTSLPPSPSSPTHRVGRRDGPLRHRARPRPNAGNLHSMATRIGSCRRTHIALPRILRELLWRVWAIPEHAPPGILDTAPAGDNAPLTHDSDSSCFLFPSLQLTHL